MITFTREFIRRFTLVLLYYKNADRREYIGLKGISGCEDDVITTKEEGDINRNMLMAVLKIDYQIRKS